MKISINFHRSRLRFFICNICFRVESIRCLSSVLLCYNSCWGLGADSASALLNAIFKILNQNFSWGADIYIGLVIQSSEEKSPEKKGKASRFLLWVLRTFITRKEPICFCFCPGSIFFTFDNEKYQQKIQTTRTEIHIFSSDLKPTNVKKMYSSREKYAKIGL